MMMKGRTGENIDKKIEIRTKRWKCGQEKIRDKEGKIRNEKTWKMRKLQK